MRAASRLRQLHQVGAPVIVIAPLRCDVSHRTGAPNHDARLFNDLHIDRAHGTETAKP